MPHVAVHLDLAERVLADWRDHPARAPVDPHAPGVRNALLSGAIAPDAGFNPGADRLLSDLAHRVRTARWPEAVLERGETEAERAYGWGWLTHVLADAALHPLVNRAAAEMLGRDRILSDMAQRWGHARAELAMDTRLHARDSGLARIRLRPVFGRRSRGRLQEAFEVVYGPGVTGATILRAHRLTSLSVGVQLVAGRAHAAADRGGSVGGRVARLGVGVVEALGRRGLPDPHFLRAYIDRDPPPAWLATRFDAYPEELIERLGMVVRGGTGTLADHDLGTGHVIDECRPGRWARRALDTLAERTGAPVALPARDRAA